MLKRSKVELEGCTLSMLEGGPQDGRLLLLLHGIPASAELWRDFATLAAEKGWHVIAIDLPGYGETTIYDYRYYSLIEFSKLISRWLSISGYGKAFLIAHDLGGIIAQYLLVNCQDQLENAVLSNCPVADSWPVSSVKKLISTANKGLFTLLSVLGVFKEETLYQAMLKSFIEKEAFSIAAFRRVFYDGKFNRYHKAKKFGHMLRKLDHVDTIKMYKSLHQVKIPIRLIWGKEDKYQPWAKTGALIHHEIKHSEPILLEGVGHFVPLEAPQALFDASFCP